MIITPSNFTTIISLLSGLSLVISIGMTIGLIIAIRSGNSKAMAEIQSSTISALQAQSETQDKEIQMLQKKIARLESVISAVQVTLQKRRGIVIEINDDIITLIDKSTGTEHTVQIHPEEKIKETKT